MLWKCSERSENNFHSSSLLTSVCVLAGIYSKQNQTHGKVRARLRVCDHATGNRLSYRDCVYRSLVGRRIERTRRAAFVRCALDGRSSVRGQRSWSSYVQRFGKFSQGSPVTGGFQGNVVPPTRRFGCQGGIFGNQDPFDTWFVRSRAPSLPVR
mgnify:CR=1 FL=1